MGTKPSEKLPLPAPDHTASLGSAACGHDENERPVRMPRKVLFEQTVELDLGDLPKWRPRRVISEAELRELDD